MKSFNCYGIRGEPDRVVVVSPDGIVDVPYDWGLAGPGGAWFKLKPFAGTTDAVVEEAKHCLRASQDVVSLSVERQPAWTKCKVCSHFHAPGDCAPPTRD
jgi:hypothetical protein